MARADVIAVVGRGDGLPFSIGLCIGLLLAATAGLAASAAAIPGRN